VRRVIGGDGVDRAVGQRLVKRCHVFRFAQWRVDFAGGVVTEQAGVGEQQVVRCDLAGHLHAACLGFAHQRYRAARRDVGQVVPSLDVLGQDQVACHDHVLGNPRPALEPESRRDHALVHVGASSELVVLSVLDHRHPEVLRVLERAPHDGARHQAHAVVADTDRARVAELRHFRQLFAFLSDGDGGDRVQAGAAGFRRPAQHQLGHRARVVHWACVRHHADVGVAARRRGPQAGSDLLFVLVARLAQVSM
jgi:hypothetical protein